MQTTTDTTPAPEHAAAPATQEPEEITMSTEADQYTARVEAIEAEDRQATPDTIAAGISNLDAHEPTQDDDTPIINDAEPPEDEDAEEADDYGTNRATYCMDDDKIRLYVGRVPRDEYEALRAEGWTSTPKQSEAGQGEFAATWTPERRDRALSYAGIIEDEDAGPAERAADRAERFAAYREKRTAEAVDSADRYDSQPRAYGFQSQARAERAARRRDGHARRAVDSWSKAEYWQSRTAGVIAHALHVSTPAVRMGRLKILEAELRAKVEHYEKAARLFDVAVSLYEIAEPEEQTRQALQFFGNITSYRDYPHPDNADERHSIYAHLTSERRRKITGKEALDLYLSDRQRPDVNDNEWAQHYKLRIAYENQMLEAQGGRASLVEMEPGGWLGKHQIFKVNRSPVTKLVVSVELRYMSECNKWGRPWSDGKGARLLSMLYNIERLPSTAYRPPTDEERAAFKATTEATKKGKAAAAKEKRDAGENCPLINPTDEDAVKMQDQWNEIERERHAKKRHYKPFEPVTPLKMTQAEYSARSGGSYAQCETLTVCEAGTEHRKRHFNNITRHSVFKLRIAKAGDYYQADRIIIISDKPQKPIPWKAIADARAKCPSVESIAPRLPQLRAAMAKNGWQDEARTESENLLIRDAVYVGYVDDSCNQVTWTNAGHAALAAYDEANQVEERRFVLVND
jgi:hypothetical protein